MALPTTFSARVRSSVVPMADRRIAGSGIAQGLSLLGRAGGQAIDRREAANEQIAASQQRMAEAEARQQQQSALLDHAARFSEAQVEIAAKVGELERQPAPGGEGHASAVRETLNEAWGTLVAQLPDDREVFDRTRAEFQAYAARMEVRADAFEAQQRAKKQGDDYETFARNSDLVIYNDPSDATLGAQLQADAAFVAAMDIGDDAKAQLLQERREGAVQSLFTGLLDKGGHAALKAALDSGRFDPFLDADGKAKWLRAAGAAEDAAQRAEDAAANERQRDALEGLKTLKLQLQRGGEEAPTVGQVNAALKVAQAAGVDESDLLEFGYMAEDALAAQGARTVATPQLQAGLAALQERIGTGEASDADRRTAAAYAAELKARDAKAGTGIAELAKTNPAQAVAQLAAMPPARRWGAASEAGQGKLAVYANMTPTGAAFAIEGAKLRTERPDDFLPPKTGARGTTGGKAAAQALFDQAIGRDLRDQLGDSYDEHFQAALDAMAGAARRWDERTFARGIQFVFGATKRADGTWQGGIGTLRHGQKVELPDRWNAAEFDMAFQRQDFAGAAYGDGSPASADDIRRHYRVRYIDPDAARAVQGKAYREGTTYYALVGPDGRLLYRTGLKAPFLLEVADSPHGRAAQAGN